MIESRSSRMQETTAPLVEGWRLGSSGESGSSREESRPETLKQSSAGAWFRLGPAGDEEIEPTSPVTRTIAPSQASRKAPIAFPAPGDALGGFRIVKELGRGAFARVYLAEQSELAGRLVALKVAEALGDEPQALARLQHAHIVPIHSVHDDPKTGLRLLCMPYVGGANLAQVLERSGAKVPSHSGGCSLIEALDCVGGRPPSLAGGSRRSFLAGASTTQGYRGAATRGLGSPTAVRSMFGRYWARLPWGSQGEGGESGPAADPVQEELDQPARRFLRSHTYVEATVWIAARLAEGLEHAHARGLLHRDIKPSNILIAADGTPMLLDFNLAIDANPAHAPHEGVKAMLGGTLPYMAPEHLDAFNPKGHTPPEAVDERSDIYALGLILFEMLAGRHAFDEPPAGLGLIAMVARMAEARLKGAPSVRDLNPAIPPSLDAIVAKCLEPDPSRRYARAADLAEDLNRHLEDRPNKYAPEPSPGERLGKWWRRHPQVRGAGPVAAMAVALLVAFVATAWTVYEYAEGAHARLLRTEFRERFARCQLLLNTTSGPASHRSEGLELADKMLSAYRVNDAEDWTRTPAVRRLTPPDRKALREEVSELILLSVRARVADVARVGSESVRRRVLEAGLGQIDRALACDPSPSSALHEDRARYLGALGRADEARAELAEAARRTPRTARDFYLRGTARAARGEIELAEADLGRAVAIDPRRFWAWFVLGLCHFDQGRFADAAGEFNACTLIAPEFAWPHLNRGLALAAQGRFVEARASYDRALLLNPNFAEARVDRALVCLELNDPAVAERDLARAMKLGRKEPEVRAARAEALARLGRREQVEQEFAEALKARPRDATILVARGFSRMAVDPEGAEADFRNVLAANPRNHRALFGLARVLASDPAEALALLDEALDADPSFNDARQFRAVLRARKGDASATSDVDRLVQSPSPQNLYNAACALALLAEAGGDEAMSRRAVEVLHRALDVGFPKAFAKQDADLASLRPRRDFAKLFQAAR